MEKAKQKSNTVEMESHLSPPISFYFSHPRFL